MRGRASITHRLAKNYPLCAQAVEKSKRLSACFKWMGWTSRAPLRVYPGAIAIARALGDCYLKDPHVLPPRSCATPVHPLCIPCASAVHPLCIRCESPVHPL